MMRELSFLAVGLLVGFFTCYLWPVAVSQETAAPAARQADGSLVAARDPDATVKPGHEIPKGGKVVRDFHVEVQPTARPECPKCVVDLSLVRLPDNTHRAVVSSPTGEVLNAIDIPREPSLIERRRVWGVGGIYDGRWGTILLRNFGDRLTVGGTINQRRNNAGDIELVPGATAIVWFGNP